MPFAAGHFDKARGVIVITSDTYDTSKTREISLVNVDQDRPLGETPNGDKIDLSEHEAKIGREFLPLLGQSFDI